MIVRHLFVGKWLLIGSVLLICVGVIVNQSFKWATTQKRTSVATATETPWLVVAPVGRYSEVIRIPPGYAFELDYPEGGHVRLLDRVNDKFIDDDQQQDHWLGRMNSPEFQVKSLGEKGVLVRIKTKPIK
ncbi:MAG: hypothetical protein AAB468_03280 [Patescibacteria group bacterium]